MSKEKRVLIFHEGKERTITNENDRYYFCGDTQFRKSNPNIKRVKVIYASKKKGE